MKHFGIIVWQRWVPNELGVNYLGWVVDTRHPDLCGRHYRTAYGAAMAARDRGMR